MTPDMLHYTTYLRPAYIVVSKQFEIRMRGNDLNDKSNQF